MCVEIKWLDSTNDTVYLKLNSVAKPQYVTIVGKRKGFGCF